MSKEQFKGTLPEKPKDSEANSLKESFLTKEEFELQIKKLYPEILVFCKSLLDNKTEGSITAEDIVQETLLNASRFYKDFRGESSLKTWLTSIATNCFYDHIRKTERDPLGKRKIKLESNGANGEQYKHDDIPTQDFSPEEELIYKIKKEEILKTIEKLPKKEQLATKLNIFEGLGPVEISNTTGGNRHTISASLHRARKKLSDLFERKIQFRGRPRNEPKK